MRVEGSRGHQDVKMGRLDKFGKIGGLGRLGKIGRIGNLGRLGYLGRIGKDGWFFRLSTFFLSSSREKKLRKKIGKKRKKINVEKNF